MPRGGTYTVLRRRPASWDAAAAVPLGKWVAVFGGTFPSQWVLKKITNVFLYFLNVFRAHVLSAPVPSCLQPGGCVGLMNDGAQWTGTPAALLQPCVE